jgi:hypothetical protein
MEDLMGVRPTKVPKLEEEESRPSVRFNPFAQVRKFDPSLLFQ